MTEAKMDLTIKDVDKFVWIKLKDGQDIDISGIKDINTANVNDIFFDLKDGTRCNYLPIGGSDLHQIDTIEIMDDGVVTNAPFRMKYIDLVENGISYDDNSKELKLTFKKLGDESPGEDFSLSINSGKFIIGNLDFI